MQPSRRVIERALGRIGRCRRMARDAEAALSSALAFFALAAATAAFLRAGGRPPDASDRRARMAGLARS